MKRGALIIAALCALTAPVSVSARQCNSGDSWWWIKTAEAKADGSRKDLLMAVEGKVAKDLDYIQADYDLRFVFLEVGVGSKPPATLQASDVSVSPDETACIDFRPAYEGRYGGSLIDSISGEDSNRPRLCIAKDGSFSSVLKIDSSVAAVPDWIALVAHGSDRNRVHLFKAKDGGCKP